MSLEFGKLDFAVSFNPTTAFPLDARYYFTSYEEAEKAALSAKEVGSSESIYYYGEIIVVVAARKATLYVITPENKLEPVRSEIHPHIFKYDEDGTLILLGYLEANNGTLPMKGSNNELQWVKPDIEMINGLEPTLEYFLEQISNIQTEIGMPSNPEEGLESTGLYELIDKKVDKQDNARLIFLEEVKKLQEIEEMAQRNYISAVNPNNFMVTEAGQLNLKEINPNQVTGLITTLDLKVDKKEGWGLSQNNFSNYYKGYIDNLIEVEGNFGFVTQKEFDETVGDMKGFAQYVGKETTTIADELYDLNERLRWQDVVKENENEE